MSKFLRAASLLCVSLLAAGTASAASILWVSDAPPNLGFSGPLSGLTDQGFVTLLQNAGHTVDRYDNPEAATSLMTQTEIDTINGYDLIILARAGGSGQYQTGQGDQWNTQITKPLICMSPYFVRTDGGRFSWFVGGNGVLPDNAAPTPVTAADPADPAVDYLLGAVEMLGTQTVMPYDELIDRNTSHITNPLEVGGRLLLSATFGRENDGVVVTANVVADFPAGLSVKAGAQQLAGYRMYFGGGSRESAQAPHNNIPLYTGRENLTATGESIFLRAVQLALNQGAPPATDPNAAPVITGQPAGVSAAEGATVSFSVASTGAGPRTLQWQRDDGAGFVDIAGASTPFLNSRLTLTNVTTADHNASFRAVITSANGSATSDAATLTVIEDTEAPVVVSVGSVDGTTILISFNEALDASEASPALDEFSYAVNGVDSPATATLLPDGRSVLLTLNTPVAGDFTVDITSIADINGNAMPQFPPITVPGSLLGLTPASVGAVNPAGSVVARSASVFEVNGGGLDLGLNATTFTDSFQFAYKMVEGDFDARVRVHSLVGIGRLESVAKAILTARESTDAGSPAVNVFVTPPAPGDDSIAGSYRSAVGVNTNSMGAFIPNGLPGNAWMRLSRVGNLFTTYRSTDGTAWSEIGSATLAFSPNLLVGVGAASHRNTFIVSATFSDFQTTAPASEPELENPSLTGTTFTASFATQAGTVYTIQFKNSLNDAEWQTLETINGDGTSKSITDTGASVPNRFYRIVIE